MKEGNVMLAQKRLKCKGLLGEICSMLFEKQFTLAASSAAKYKATETDKELIRKHIADGVSLEELSIYKVVASSSRPDSGGDVLERPVLEQLAKEYSEGRTVVLGSHSRAAGIGRTFAGEVIKANDGADELIVKMFVPKAAQTPQGPANAIIGAGIYSRPSIMAMWNEDPKPTQDEVGGRRIRRYASAKGMRAIHLALVDMGANYDAVMKEAGTPQTKQGAGNNLASDNPTTNEMDKITYSIKNLQIGGEVELKAAALQPVFEQVEKAVTSLNEELAKAKNENVALLKELEGFREAQTTELKGLQDEYQNLSKQVNPDADAATLAKRAGLYTVESLDLLKSDIADMKKRLAELKKGIDPKPAKAKRYAASEASEIFEL